MSNTLRRNGRLTLLIAAGLSALLGLTVLIDELSQLVSYNGPIDPRSTETEPVQETPTFTENPTNGTLEIIAPNTPTPTLTHALTFEPTMTPPDPELEMSNALENIIGGKGGFNLFNPAGYLYRGKGKITINGQNLADSDSSRDLYIVAGYMGDGVIYNVLVQEDITRGEHTVKGRNSYVKDRITSVAQYALQFAINKYGPGADFPENTIHLYYSPDWIMQRGPAGQVFVVPPYTPFLVEKHIKDGQEVDTFFRGGGPPDVYYAVQFSELCILPPNWIEALGGEGLVVLAIGIDGIAGEGDSFFEIEIPDGLLRDYVEEREKIAEGYVGAGPDTNEAFLRNMSVAKGEYTELVRDKILIGLDPKSEG